MALFARTLLLFSFGGVIMALGSAKQSAEVRRARAVKFAGFFVIVHGVLALAYAGRLGIIALAVAIVAFGIFEATKAWRLIPDPRPSLLITGGSAAAAAFLYVAVRADPMAVAWLFLVTAAFDGLGQVIGQLAGRRLLAPSISPAKTVEGLTGALAGAVLVAVWLRELPGYDVPRAAILGGAVGVASLVGDLTGSWTKRRAGIKDFSSILPGQGGVLDRFNSFIAAMALVGAWL
jgi:phosphatidate cytidylyltransferase